MQRRIWHKIYGRVPHWNEPHDGTKYSVIIFRAEPRMPKHALIAMRAKARREVASPDEPQPAPA